MNSVKRHQLMLVSIAVILFTTIPFIASAQTYLETFGQNRIQYRKFSWKYFDTKHFRIYHYDLAGRQLGRYVAEEAERDITVVEQKLGGQFPKRFNIILYNSYEEYRQTNVGLKNDAQTEQNTPAGTVDLVGDKLVVYFTGQHADLKRQIRAGMSRVVMERMLFGESFRQMVKSAVSMNLPLWVTDGYIAYLVDGWDANSNNKWKSLMDAHPGKGFYELSELYPEIAGKAFWKFVSEQFGETTVKNLLYTMQQKSSLNQGMKSPQTLGLKVRKAYDSCMVFYRNEYALDAKVRELPDSSTGLLELKVPKDNSVIRNIRVSPKGNDVAYVSWKDGEYNVFIQKTQFEKQRSTILTGGRQDFNEAADPDYPILAWSNNGYKLAILYKKGTQTRIRIYNSLKAKIENYIIPKNRFDRALGMTFMEEDDKLVFSAIRKSQTDLYEFTIRGSKMKNITNDAWDDTQPFFISGGSRRGILFLSNRPKPDLNVPLQVNELPTGPNNVFFYDTKTKRSELLQCSRVTSGHITQPIQYGSENFAYLYDSNGIQNKYVVLFGRTTKNMDSAYGVPITNYPENIISHQYNPASNSVADVVQIGDEYKIFFHDLRIPGVNVAAKTLTPTPFAVDKTEEIAPAQPIENDSRNRRRHHREENNEPAIKSGTTFQSEFPETPAAPAKHSTTEAVSVATPGDDLKKTTAEDSSYLPVVNDSAYLKMKPAPYKLSFKPDFLTARVDNSILFNQYQSYQNNGGQIVNPPLSGLITVSLNDLMENHRFTAGIQLPIDGSGSAYFLQYQNFSRRVDWGVLYLRTQNSYTYNINYPVDTAHYIPELQPGKSISNLIQTSFSYPFDRIRSLKFHTALRLDQLNLKPVDTITLKTSLPYNIANTFWSLSRLEYVFDNTISPALNIRNGFRYKFYVEYIEGINNGNKGCYNFGLDFRYYKKIYKNFIWANRIAYAHSDGNDEVVYFLGGVDNWISPQQDNFVPVNGNYGFQAVATSLRGYNQQARNGNNFAVLNSEFRLPVLTTFLKRPIQSAILKNLQLVAFVDAGSAWVGFLPDAANTTQNYTFSTGGTMPAYQSNLMLATPYGLGLGVGYGGGLRTTLFGYFIRVDAAWNIDGIKKPIWYFSLGTDF